MRNYKEHMTINNLFDEQRPSGNIVAPTALYDNDSRHVS